MTAATTTLQQNQIPNTVGLQDFLALHKKDFLLSINCHHIGQIQSFNPVTQTATATIQYKKTFFEQDSLTGAYSAKMVDYPILLDCPVICLGGGTAALTFPITIGDECLVLFNDRDIDNWFSGSVGGSVATPRLHSFADGLILVGIRSLANVIPAVSPARAELRNGAAKVNVACVAVSPTESSLEAVSGATRVKAGTKVNVQNAGGTNNLYTILNSILSQLQTLVTQCAAITVVCAAPSNPSSIPVNSLAITAVGTALAPLITQLGALLE